MRGNSAKAPAYVDCPQCWQRLALTNIAPGQVFQCPHCGGRSHIPPPAAPVSPTLVGVGAYGLDLGTRVPPPAAPVSPTAVSPAATAPNEKSSPLVKYVLVAAGVVTLAIVGTLLAVTLSHDSWESYHGGEFAEKVKQAEAFRESNPLGAYRMLEGALDEASSHKVKDPDLQRAIENAKNAKDALFVQVEKIIREQEAEAKRLEEERRLAKEKEARQIAEAKRAKDEAAEIEARREKEKKERQAAAHARVKAYADVPKSARDALNAVKRIEARTEVGVAYVKYSEAVGESWADVKIFVESPEGKQLSELSDVLRSAISAYKSAMDSWRWKLDARSDDEKSVWEHSLQTSWKHASEYIELADKLLAPDSCETALEAIAEMAADKEVTTAN